MDRNKKIYFLQERNIRGNTAGTKLKDDLMSFFKSENCIPLNKVPLYSSNRQSILYYLKSLFSIVTLIITLLFSHGKTIFMIYPFIKISLWKRPLISASKRNRIIVFLFDIRYFQYKCFDNHKNFSLEEETSFLNNFSECIALTKSEEQLLKQHGLSIQTHSLEFLDYKSSVYCRNYSDRVKNSVAYAGYLPRAKFLNNISSATLSQISIHVFGDIGSVSSFKDGLIYHGSYNSSDLVKELSMFQFGLVWDGDDCDSFGSFYGGYEKYIIPHKAACYINSGLPIIVWRDSAIASFVNEFEIGICIDCIDDIPAAISKLEEKDYLRLIKNVSNIQMKTSSFGYMKTIFDKIVNKK